MFQGGDVGVRHTYKAVVSEILSAMWNYLDSVYVKGSGSVKHDMKVLHLRALAEDTKQALDSYVAERRSTNVMIDNNMKAVVDAMLKSFQTLAQEVYQGALDKPKSGVWGSFIGKSQEEKERARKRKTDQGVMLFLSIQLIKVLGPMVGYVFNTNTLKTITDNVSAKVRKEGLVEVNENPLSLEELEQISGLCSSLQVEQPEALVAMLDISRNNNLSK